MTAVIYIAINRQNGHAYVGQSTQFKIRKRTHFRNALSGVGCISKFYRAIRKYGSEAFIWVCLPAALETLDILEKYWIEKLDSRLKGYNCAPGGSDGIRGMFSGYRHSEESRKKIAMAGIGRIPGVKTRLLMASWERTSSMCGKISKSLQGIKRSEETIKKMSLAKIGNRSKTGQKLSAETRARISQSQKARLALRKG